MGLRTLSTELRDEHAQPFFEFQFTTITPLVPSIAGGPSGALSPLFSPLPDQNWGTLYAVLVFPMRQDSAHSQKTTGSALFRNQLAVRSLQTFICL